jgi:hypothetical protein
LRALRIMANGVRPADAGTSVRRGRRQAVEKIQPSFEHVLAPQQLKRASSRRRLALRAYPAISLCLHGSRLLLPTACRHQRSLRKIFPDREAGADKEDASRPVCKRFPRTRTTESSACGGQTFSYRQVTVFRLIDTNCARRARVRSPHETFAACLFGGRPSSQPR